MAALSAYGFHRFQTLTADLDTPLPFGVAPETYQKQLEVYTQAVQAALHTEYSEIFLITAVLVRHRRRGRVRDGVGGYSGPLDRAGQGSRRP